MKVLLLVVIGGVYLVSMALCSGIAWREFRADPRLVSMPVLARILRLKAVSPTYRRAAMAQSAAAFALAAMFVAFCGVSFFRWALH